MTNILLVIRAQQFWDIRVPKAAACPRHGDELTGNTTGNKKHSQNFVETAHKATSWEIGTDRNIILKFTLDI
jgi:hypothetical protein